jgi:hypothetical protein
VKFVFKMLSNLNRNLSESLGALLGAWVRSREPIAAVGLLNGPVRGGTSLNDIIQGEAHKHISIKLTTIVRTARMAWYSHICQCEKLETLADVCSDGKVQFSLV